MNRCHWVLRGSVFRGRPLALLPGTVLAASSLLTMPSASADPPSTTRASTGGTTPTEDSIPKAARSLYLDGTFGSLGDDGRVESANAVGLELGFYTQRVRVSARITAGVDSSIASNREELAGTGQDQYIGQPHVLIGGGLGYALYATDGFVLAPGLTYWRAQHQAFGWALGANVPFLWVSRHRLRIGFEIGYHRAFGGYGVSDCRETEEHTCVDTEPRRVSIPSAGTMSAGFVMGFEFGR